MLLKNVEDVRLFAQLIAPVVKMPIFFIDSNGLLLFEISSSNVDNPLCDYRDNLYLDILSHTETPYPQTFSSKYLENFLVLHVKISEKVKGFLVFGPSVAHMSSEAIQIIIDEPLSAREKSSLTKYYRTLHVINYHDLIKLGVFVHFLITKEVVEFDSINTVSNALKNVQTKVENESNIQYRDVNNLHRSSFFERYFYALIKAGETAELQELLKVHSLDGEYIVLSKNNPLRSWKNLVICFITISCRAAMEGGLPTETTYAISDVYIQELEDLSSIKDVEDFASKVFLDLAERVRKIKEQQFSKLITACQDYISKNLGENISLVTISTQLKVNSSYLSSQFKKDTGIALTDYIHMERISEAKRMLLFTQFSILDIYSSLGFCDQSHFTKAFKKATGLTPKQFRDTNSSSTIWY